MARAVAALIKLHALVPDRGTFVAYVHEFPLLKLAHQINEHHDQADWSHEWDEAIAGHRHVIVDGPGLEVHLDSLRKAYGNVSYGDKNRDLIQEVYGSEEAMARKIREIAESWDKMVSAKNGNMTLRKSEMKALLDLCLPTAQTLRPLHLTSLENIGAAKPTADDDEFVDQDLVELLDDLTQGDEQRRTLLNLAKAAMAVTGRAVLASDLRNVGDFTDVALSQLAAAINDYNAGQPVSGGNGVAPIMPPESDEEQGEEQKPKRSRKAEAVTA